MKTANTANAVRRVGALTAVAAVVVLLAAILFRLNPAEVPAPTVDPSELLQDPSFEQPATLGAWSAGGRPEVFTTLNDSTALNLQRVGRLSRGAVTQDVLLTPVRGRPYRFSVWIRRSNRLLHPTPVAGVVTAQTACAANEEIAETPFAAAADWSEVVATIQPVSGERCTMRVGIRAPAGEIDLDNATFGDAGLINGSFELGPVSGTLESWTVDRGVGVTVLSNGAANGRRFARLIATSASVGIRQDAPIDPSSEPLLGQASVMVRGAKGPARVLIEYHEPCSKRVHRVSVTVGTHWQRMLVRQPRLPADAVPDSLIKVDGVGCAAQLAIVLASPGTVDVDGAELQLRSYWPPEGSPSYRRIVARRATVSNASS